MNLFILRHGQTDYNLLGKFQGQVNTTLNETGIKQAYETKELLKNINFDVIICSPLQRAIKTANIVTNDAPFIIDNRIIERSFGSLEGQFGIEDFENYLDKYNIENYTSLCNRVYSFLDDITKKYSDMNNILITTHEGIAQIINTYFDKNYNIYNWKNFRLQTGNYKKYII